MSRRSNIAKPGLIPYLTRRLSFPLLPETLLHSPVSPTLKAEPPTLYSSASSSDHASTASSFDVEQKSAAWPRLWHLLHSSSCAVDPPMALYAILVTSHLGGTTIGGFGAAAITAGGRGRATTVLIGGFTAASLRPRRPPFSLPRPPSFPWSPPPALLLWPPSPSPANMAWPAWPTLNPSSCFQKVGDAGLAKP